MKDAVRNSLREKKKTQLAFSTSTRMLMLTFSEEESSPLRMGIFVGHFVQLLGKHGRATEELTSGKNNIRVRQ
jgi:hypothetical protein